MVLINTFLLVSPRVLESLAKLCDMLGFTKISSVVQKFQILYSRQLLGNNFALFRHNSDFKFDPDAKIVLMFFFLKAYLNFIFSHYQGCL